MHTKPPAPSRHLLGRRPVVGHQAEDYPEDAPTVLVNDLEDLGIDPDSLATAPGIARRLRRDATAAGTSISSRSPLLAPPKPRRAPRVNFPDPQSPRAQREDQTHLVLILSAAALPVVLSLAAAMWLAFG